MYKSTISFCWQDVQTKQDSHLMQPPATKIKGRLSQHLRILIQSMRRLTALHVLEALVQRVEVRRVGDVLVDLELQDDQI